jgi:hypothetical protein
VRYLPNGPELEAVRHVVIGATACAGASLVLSHAPGAPTPPPLRAATNAEIALNLLRSSRRDGLLAGVDVVTADRFDADTLLAVWVLLQPEAALVRAARVVDAAHAGAFRVHTSGEAAKFICWVNGFRDEHALDENGRAFRIMLPQVAAVLDDPRAHDLYWIGEYSDITQSEALLNSGAVQIDEYPDLDLAVLQTPLDLHDLVRFSATGCSRVLTVRSENTYMLEYRLESWVREPPRRTLPRLDLRPLAARLNLFERSVGAWRAEPVDARTPRLYLESGDGRPAPSALDAETVIAEVLDFLRGHASDHRLVWSPSMAGRAAP